MTLVRKPFERLADYLAIALAASLPWSTSATGMLAAAWLIAVIPTVDLASLRRIILTPAGGCSLLVVALAALGTLWADVTWSARMGGLVSFLKLLFIPLLLYRYSRSDSGRGVLIGFLASCTALLAASWLLIIWPQLPWQEAGKTPGVPVKDYISQGAMFTICIFAILQFAYDRWRGGSRPLALALLAFALLFLANVFYVATSRTSLVVIPILLIVFGYRLSGWKGAVGLIVGLVLVVMAAWPSATYLRVRVNSLFDEVRAYRPDAIATPAGERLEFWRKSIGFVTDAPVIGHGTGSIREQFRRAAVGQTGMAAEISANPHNQILGIGIQLGIVGIAALLMMWIAHLVLFRGPDFAAWVGLVVVVQNVVGSQFNSHLLDFTHGWAYVVGVGIAGGVVLRNPAPPS